MHRMGLSYAEFQVWLATIRHTHERRIHLTVLDLEHKVLSHLTPRFVDGQVTGDVTRNPTRVLEIDFFDPSRSIQFEPDSPSEAPIHMRRMLRCDYSVRVPALGRWVSCPVFTGPVYDFDRTGPDVHLVANGKEWLMSGQAGRNRTFPKKTRKTRVLKELFADSGETFLSIPDLPVTMPERLVVHRMDSRWPKVQRVAHSMNREPFYDGDGIGTVRRPTERPVLTIDDRTRMSDLGIDRNPDGLHNTWEVLGKDPKGPKPQVHGRVALPDHNPLSSSPQWGLGRNGERMYLIEQVKNTHIKTNHEALVRARKLRDDHARVLTNFSIDTLPIPNVEENDLFRVLTDEGAFLIRNKQWSLPLGIDGNPVMTLGSMRRAMLSQAHGKRGRS